VPPTKKGKKKRAASTISPIAKKKKRRSDRQPIRGKKEKNLLSHFLFWVSGRGKRVVSLCSGKGGGEVPMGRSPSV